jgi:hypothetical protein
MLMPALWALGSLQVFMGALATDAREDEVRAALAALGQGEVLSVRLQVRAELQGGRCGPRGRCMAAGPGVAALRAVSPWARLYRTAGYVRGSPAPS